MGAAVSGERTRRRAQELLDLRAALHKAAGQVELQARRWRGGWVGQPARLRVRYRPEVDDSAAAWAGDVAAVVGRRLDATYRVSKHERRRRTVWLRLTPAAADSPTSAAQVRVQRLVHELLGASAEVTTQWGDDETLNAVEVRHDVGVRVATAAQRARIERVMSAMVPGRWRARWDLEADLVRFELRPTLPAKVDHAVGSMSGQDALRLPYAVDEDGRTIYWDLALNAVAPHMLVVGGTGSGKALDGETEVPTPSGWTTMGDLRRGDVVFDEAGRPCRVVSAHPVQHDRPCYELQFSDGSTVVADEEHLWTVSRRTDRVRASKGYDRETPLHFWVGDQERRRLTDVLRQVCAEPDQPVTVDDAVAILGDQHRTAVRIASQGVEPIATTRVPWSRSRLGQVQTGSHPVVAYSRRGLIEAAVAYRCRPKLPQRGPLTVTLTTGQMVTGTAVGSQRYTNYSVQVAGPLHYPTQEQPIDPYVLGIWLGDGRNNCGEITTADPEVVAEINRLGYPCSLKSGRPTDRYQYVVRNDFQSRLRAMRVLGDKHIPRTYAQGDVDQRMALLQGLMDSDGTAYKAGGVSFTSTLRVLVEQVRDLVASLGMKPTVTTRAVTFGGRDCGTAWKVSWTTAQPVFRLPRKRDRQVSKVRSVTSHRYITAIRPVASRPVRCITVDSPSRLYLVTRSCIPTHNTVLINGLLLEACRRGWQVYVADPKRIEFLGLREWPNVAIVATYVEAMVAVIHRVHEVMEGRYEAIENGTQTEDDFEPVLLLLDEFRNFHRQVAAWYGATKVRGMPSKCPVLEQVAAIAEKGRSAHVHLVIGTQRPDAEWLGGSLRDQFASRASLGRLSPQGAMMMWEAAHVGVAIPKNFPGRATVAGVDGHPVEAQTFWTPDPRRVRKPPDQVILDQLRPAALTHPPLVLVPPLVDDLDGDGATRPLTYYDWIDAAFVPAATRPDLVSSTGSGDWGSAAAAVADEGEDLTDEADGTDENSAQGAADGDGYEVAEQVAVEALLPGTLVLVDVGAWAVVEACEPDIVDDGNWCVDWRDDDGEVGSLSLAEGDTVTARLPLEVV